MRPRCASAEHGGGTVEAEGDDAGTDPDQPSVFTDALPDRPSAADLGEPASDEEGAIEPRRVHGRRGSVVGPPRLPVRMRLDRVRAEAGTVLAAWAICLLERLTTSSGAECRRLLRRLAASATSQTASTVDTGRRSACRPLAAYALTPLEFPYGRQRPAATTRPKTTPANANVAAVAAAPATPSNASSGAAQHTAHAAAPAPNRWRSLRDEFMRARFRGGCRSGRTGWGSTPRRRTGPGRRTRRRVPRSGCLG